MAKALGKKSTTARASGRHRTNLAEQMAALRWLVMRIDQLCIEVLVTDHGKFGLLENALRAQVTLLQRMGRPTIAVDECPGGFMLCRDGLCAPMCDDDAPPPSFMAGTSRKRRR